MTATGRTTRGTVTVLVLVMVAILAIVAAGTLLMARAELGASAAARRSRQARAAAMSGIHRAISVILNPPADGRDIRDNPALFQAQPLDEEDPEGWRFTVFAVNLTDPSSPRYGPSDEAARLDVNTATEAMLLKLPGMTEERVHCLLDYRDADSTPRAQGLESDPAGGGATYVVKNAPLYTPEELLLVSGFTGRVVYGDDANFNGMLEANEDDGEESFPPDDGDGELSCGLRPLVTTFSYDPDLDRDGQPRIDINKTDPAELRERLHGAGIARATVEFIAEARKAGRKFTDPSELLEASLEIDDPDRKGRKKTIRSEVGREELPVVMDKLTCGATARYRGRAVLRGRINVNTAPPEVLRTLDGLGESAAGWIVRRRGDLDADARATTAWLYTDDVVSAEEFKRLAPRLTARSYQFRVRSFGYSMAHGAYCVLEAVIDVASGRPELMYLRDLTALGPPVPVTGIER